jgi:hypothetical protein
MQPLDGAYQRVKRAGIHLANLNRRINVLSKRISDNVVINRNPTTFALPDGRQVNGVWGKATFPIEPVPHIIKILVGEITYNLRASLDYLIYELAHHDSHSIQELTQFPIEDCKEVFWGRHRHYIKGLSDQHVTMVEGFQPYSGCKWTRTLRDLSNPDKHRQLTISKSSVIYAIPQGSTEAILANKPVNMKSGLSVHVKFTDGTSIMDIDTLKQLKFEITKVLDLFNSEFK